MDRRSSIVVGVIIIVAVALGAMLLVRKHGADVTRQAAQAKYDRLESITARSSYAIDQFQKESTAYEAAQRQGQADGEERHRLWTESPFDLADSLTSVRAEQQDVQRLGALAQSKADAARNAATSLGSYFGDATLNPVLDDITAASEAELKYLADWNRAASAVNDILTARVNGHWWDVPYTQDEIESLYRAADEDEAVSTSRWNGVASRLADLQNRLRGDLLAAQPEGAVATTVQITETPEPPPIAASPTATQSTPTAPAVVPSSQAQSSAPARSAQVVSSQQQGPLSAGEVLPLLRATSALTVSTNPDGHSAYVTVPDTSASGTADANRMISGQLADGRWVVFVPLASGSPSVGDMYSLAWVWIDGRASFVGEIPAENNGLGQLSTSIHNGEIYISWPVCCPRATRTKINTLDGIRFRLLSDRTS
jgi:hypothetical protein